jgi:hypothetical protein
MKLLIFLLLTFIPLFSFCQQIPTQHYCGLGTKECSQLKKRLFDNRKNIPTAVLQQHLRSQTTTWLPIDFMIVGDKFGNYYTDTSLLDITVCQLNDAFSDFNVQFYEKSIRYLNDSLLDYNPFDSTAQVHAAGYKQPNSINIFVSRNQIYQNLYGVDFSFYSLSNDFVVFDQQIINRYNISAHEMGHFFSLLHTFFGWEYQTNVDYNNHFGNPAPDSFYIPDFGGQYVQVENVARTGVNANCNQAGDGFCDTPSDYVNTAVNCLSSFDLRDPHNVLTVPDESNMMSYFLCKNQFSPEQGLAMLADITRRGWNNLAPPGAAIIDTTGIQALQPTNNQTINIANPTTTLSWSPLLNASRYQVKLFRQGVIPGLRFVILDTVVYTNTFQFNSNLLTVGQNYTWHIRGENDYDKCSSFSNFFNFQVSTVSSTSTLDSSPTTFDAIAYQNSIECRISSNNADQGNILLYNALGQLITSTLIKIQKGEQILHLPLTNRSNHGIYVVVLQLQNNVQQVKKISLQ